MPLDRPAHDLARRDVEGRQKAGGAVPPVVVRSRLRVSVRHRKRPPHTSQRLSPRLFIHREHDGMVGRADIKADNIADLELEPRIPGHLEVFN